MIQFYFISNLKRRYAITFVVHTKMILKLEELFSMDNISIFVQIVLLISKSIIFASIVLKFMMILLTSLMEKSGLIAIIKNVLNG